MCPGHDYTPAGQAADRDWDDPAAKDVLVSALINDANALLAALAEADLADDPGAEFAVALLALVAGQDVEPAEGSDGTDGRWRIARRVARIGWSPRWTRMRGIPASPGEPARWVPGARVGRPETGIIDEKVTKAAGQDNSDPRSRRSSWTPRTVHGIRGTRIPGRVLFGVDQARDGVRAPI